MSVGTFTLFNSGKEALLADKANQINWETDAIVAVLLNASYTPNAAHTIFSDVSSTQISDAGYAPVVLSNKTVVRTNGTILWDCDDINFGSNVSITAKRIVLIKRAGASLVASDQLIGHCDLNTTSNSATVSSTNSNFVVNTPNGLFDV